MSVDAVLKETEAMSADELAELIDRLQDRLAGAEPSPDLTDAQKAELRRRIAAADADPRAGVPWETVLADSLARANG